MSMPLAPGVKRRRRADGTAVFYWCASAPGYTPRTVRLHWDETPDGLVEMSARARVLQAEMLDWVTNGPRRAATAKSGTIAWILDRYQTDEDSPYRDLRASSRKAYDESIAITRRTVGERVLASVDGSDLRRWYKEWSRNGENPRRAYGCIQILRIVLSYGVTIRSTPCREVREILSAMQFEIPRKRRSRMTSDQARAIRKAAHERKVPSVALAVAFMFELALRQKDVIGEWTLQPEAGGIVDGPELRNARRTIYAPRLRQAWGQGLLWSHIDEKGVLRKPTSKSNGHEIAEHSLNSYPDLMAEIDLVPMEKRVGPIIVARSGMPYRKREFARLFRACATAAGVPADVWSMDARAGAISEAYEAGAAAEDAMKFATHTQMATSMRYNRGALEQTTRVAELRAKRRKG